MKLLTKEIKKLPPLCATEKIDAPDKVIRVKFFTPWTDWIWYGVEYDPKEKRFFGLVYGHEKEWGYFSLDELEEIRGPAGLRIERDLYFKPKRVSELRG